MSRAVSGPDDLRRNGAGAAVGRGTGQKFAAVAAARLSPQTLPARPSVAVRPVTLAPLIAVVGADGSGKSTLTADLACAIGRHYPVSHRYLGQGSGDLGRRIGAWPIIGGAIHRLAERRATAMRRPDGASPGLLTAWIGYRFSMKRVARFRAMLADRLSSRIVVTDRYPQVEIPGFYDGPTLSASQNRKGWVAYLTAREARLYDWMTAYRPDCVIRLNVDLDHAFARKPDHPRDQLADKIAVTPRLNFNGARIFDIDANRPLAEVREEAWRIVRETLAARGYVLPASIDDAIAGPESSGAA